MPVTRVDCYLATCDLCGVPFNEDSHYTSATEARAAARYDGWEHLSDDRLICPDDDARHHATIAADAALKALM